MKTHFIAVAVLLGAISCHMRAEDFSLKPLPDGARVSVVFQNDGKFLLGESIDLTFTLSNVGATPFLRLPGNDSRRYGVTVTDETGKQLLPKQIDPNGMLDSVFVILKPGDAFNIPLRIQNYVIVDRPGTFTVRISKNFGWLVSNENPLPVAEAQITITLPTATEAEKLVTDVCAIPESKKEYETGRRSEVVEFGYLNHPVFLSALEKCAAQGDIRTVDSIHLIKTQEATQALVRLLGSDKPGVAFAAADVLSRRIPPRKEDGYFRTRGLSQEEIVVYSALWVPEALEPLRTMTVRLLASNDVRDVNVGAFIVENIGTPEQAPMLLKALEKIMEKSKDRTNPQDDILDSPGAGDAIIQAFSGLRERGYRAPEVGGVAEIMVSFLELADPKVPRAKGWEEPLKAFITQSPPMLREAAVLALPKPPAGEWQKILLEALNDKDRGVMRRACAAAGESKDPAFIKPLANIVRVERNDWVLREASDSLVKLGAHLEAVDAWVERLGDEDVYFEGLQFLAEKLEHEKTGSSSGSTDLPREARIAMREKWQRFFSDEKRRALVRAGKQVPVTEEEARDLFSGAFAFEYAGGREWPSRNP